MGLIPNWKPPCVGATKAVATGFAVSSFLVAISFLKSSSFGAFAMVPKPKVNLEAAVAPNWNLVVEESVASVLVLPGLGCSQQAHFVRFESLRVMQASHSHFDAFC